MLGPMVKMTIGGFPLGRPAAGSTSTAVFGDGGGSGYAISRGSQDGDDPADIMSTSAASFLTSTTSNSL